MEKREQKVEIISIKSKKNQIIDIEVISTQIIKVSRLIKLPLRFVSEMENFFKKQK